MKDLVTRGTGNSRLLKSSIPAGTTWEEALALLRAGTFPIDLKGLNSAGVSTTGSAYNKANVLPDSLCSSLGITSATAEPKDAWNALLQKANTINTSLNNFINNDFPQPSKQGVSRPNILENWYFVGGGSQNGNGRFPINQKGTTSQTSAGYFCDRWRKASANGTVTLYTGSMGVTGTGSAYCLLDQAIEYSNRLLGKRATISMLNTQGVITSATATLPSSLPTEDTLYISASAIGGVFVQVRGTSSHLYFRIGAQNTSTNGVVAVKLELGPNQTLARQVGSTYVLTEIPHFATELMKCQRHMYVFPRLTNTAGGSDYGDVIGFGAFTHSSYFYGFIPLPIAMRTTPTLSGTLYLRYANDNFKYLQSGDFSSPAILLKQNGIVFAGYIYGASSIISQHLFQMIPICSGDSTAILQANL